ncbi:toxic anion resistance family protein [Helicobacter didelphidarum]|uniref:Toxic anion resistance family protein n=2 Tax=Helicobacter didelphidarum TaxID=2040648 RepID=A0A3D8ISV5_9HELI|nr:toxic anion resistance family protein [Helicobacter didelphidarum]
MANTLIDELNKGIANGEIKRDMVDKFAEEEKIQSMQISEMIRGNLANLEGRDKPVFDALKSLQNTISDLNPNNFKPSFFEKLFGKTTKSMKQYFQKFQDNQDLLNEILKQLDTSKETLLRDNIALGIEAQRNAELAHKLEEQLALANEANNYIESILNTSSHTAMQHKLLTIESNNATMQSNTEIISHDSDVIPEIYAEITHNDIEISEKNRDAIQNQILFPLKQKIMDFQQQILVHTQGEVALKTLINNNKELVNSVDRTKSVTLNALNMAIITAQGLEQQQRVLKAVQDINTQTSDLIAHTGAKLKEQGVQIQQGAANTMLDMDKLKEAFDNVITAMEDMKTFKVNALPKMQENINLYDKYLGNMKKAMQKS